MMSRNVRGFMSLFWSEKPVVCKIHGFCVAGGTDMALCSDLLVVEEDAKIGYPPARVWGVPTTALWAHRLGPTRAKRLLLTGDSISGREAVDWGLATDSAPAAGLDAAFEALLERVARLPINQLVMHKLQVNRRSSAQGLHSTQAMSNFFDGIARHTPEGHAFAARAAEAGFKAAVRERDEPFGDFGLAREGSPGVRILITSSRMPFALGMVRQLTAAGHEVYAADTFERASGSHSQYAAGHFVYPRRARNGGIRRRARADRDRERDRVVIPAFEEAFFMSTQLERLSRSAKFYVASFSALARLHDKAAFQELVRGLGLPIPETLVATSDAELAEAIERFDQYFGRAVFSRGGVELLTNAGPLAGQLAPSDVHPTPQEPWVIQPFVEGETVCTYSTAHGGRVTSHLQYRIPRQWHHATGIQFESADANESLHLIEPIVAELNYTGQISFDFLVTDHGLSFVECNPRATDGALLLEPFDIARGLLEPDAETFVLPAGHSTQLDLALVGDAFSDHLKRVPETIHDLARIKDAGDGWHDPLPTLYSAFAVVHFAGVGAKEHAKLQDAMDADMTWDGEPITGMSEADAKLLAQLTHAG